MADSDSFNNYTFPRMWKRFLRSPLAILLFVNVLVFVVIALCKAFLHEDIATWLMLSAPIEETLLRPWGLITYMFTQVDVINLIFNMMWLWAFGAILSRMGSGRLVVPAYLIGGLFGGITFLITIAVTGATYGSNLIGASAAVLGVITLCALRFPRLELNLFLFGTVQLRWVAVVAILLCGLAPGFGNTPTLAVHLGGITGGAVLGFFKRKKGYKPYNKKPQIRNFREQERRGLSESDQKELDKLLDQVKISGYKSLSMKQRTRLFELSKKINV